MASMYVTTYLFFKEHPKMDPPVVLSSTTGKHDGFDTVLVFPWPVILSYGQVWFCRCYLCVPINSRSGGLPVVPSKSRISVEFLAPEQHGPIWAPSGIAPEQQGPYGPHMDPYGSIYVQYEPIWNPYGPMGAPPPHSLMSGFRENIECMCSTPTSIVHIKW